MPEIETRAGSIRIPQHTIVHFHVGDRPSQRESPHPIEGRIIRNHICIGYPTVSLSEQAQEKGSTIVDLRQTDLQCLLCVFLSNSPSEIHGSHMHMQPVASGCVLCCECRVWGEGRGDAKAVPFLQLRKYITGEIISFSMHIPERGRDKHPRISPLDVLLRVLLFFLLRLQFLSPFFSLLLFFLFLLFLVIVICVCRHHVLIAYGIGIATSLWFRALIPISFLIPQ